jgi:hypothetical protein
MEQHLEIFGLSEGDGKILDNLIQFMTSLSLFLISFSNFMANVILSSSNLLNIKLIN